MSVVSLDQLKIGQSGKVIKIEGSTEQLRRRLIDMGIISGTQILMCKRAPMGDPIEIRLRGYQLTIREADAKNITLELDK